MSSVTSMVTVTSGSAPPDGRARREFELLPRPAGGAGTGSGAADGLAPSSPVMVLCSDMTCLPDRWQDARREAPALGPRPHIVPPGDETALKPG
jgi:hypothetical protein